MPKRIRLQLYFHGIFIDVILRWTSIHNWEKFAVTRVIVFRMKTRLQTSLSVVGPIRMYGGTNQFLTVFVLVMISSHFSSINLVNYNDIFTDVKNKPYMKIKREILS